MKSVLITGATRNTGFAAARLFAKEGYGVAITGRDKERAVAAANAIADEFGVKAAGYGFDITDTAEVERVFLQAENDLGSIECLCCKQRKSRHRLRCGEYIGESFMRSFPQMSRERFSAAGVRQKL